MIIFEPPGLPSRRLSLFGGDADAEADQQDSCHGFDGAANGRPSQTIPEFGEDDGNRGPAMRRSLLRRRSPSSMNPATEAPSGAANCGSRLAKKIAIFGLARSLSRPCRKHAHRDRRRLTSGRIKDFGAVGLAASRNAWTPR